MSIGKMLVAYHALSDAIWKSFGCNDSMGEWIEDFTGCNWYNNGGEEICIIKDGNEYAFEVYGTSVWTSDGYTIAKIYNGSGEMYCIMMASKYEVDNSDDWEDIIEKNLKEE